MKMKLSVCILWVLTASCLGILPPLFELSSIEVGGNTDQGEEVERITGGTNASPGEFPWQISMQKVAKGPFKRAMHFCGGSVLNETHIVTAAHCVKDQHPEKVEVVAGAHRIKDMNEASQQRVKVKQFIANPKYDGDTISSDSALIVLDSPLVLNDRVKPIRLAPHNHQPNGTCVNTGWGNSNYFGTFPPMVPEQLQKVELMIIERDQCQKRMGPIKKVDETMICAGNGPRKGACQGDSGGPLVCYDLPNGEPYLAGIVSWGLPWCGLLYTVYGNVAALRPFLDGTTAEVTVPAPEMNSTSTNTTYF